MSTAAPGVTALAKPLAKPLPTAMSPRADGIFVIHYLGFEVKRIGAALSVRVRVNTLSF